MSPFREKSPPKAFVELCCFRPLGEPMYPPLHARPCPPTSSPCPTLNPLPSRTHSKPLPRTWTGRHHRSCSVMAPSTCCLSPTWDHFTFAHLRYFLHRPHLWSLLYAGESLKKPNTELQMVPPRRRKVCGRCGYGEALMVTVPVLSVSSTFSCG